MKTPIRKFRLKREYITSISDVKKMIITFDDGKTLPCDSYSTIDHPKFTELRDKLEQEGYIKTERLYWNGDRVLKPFILNGMAFNLHENFYCACALDVRFKVKEKQK